MDKSENWPEYPHSKTQQQLIIASSRKLIGESEEDDRVYCKVCSLISEEACLDKLKAFNEKKDFETCKAFLAKHSKLQIAMLVGLLVDAAPVVAKRFNFSQTNFHEFFDSVTSQRPDGPIMDLNDTNHPQAFRLLGSVQEKLRLFCWKDPT